MDFEEVSRDLEGRAARLSLENNPRNLGIDEIVISVSRLVKALGVASISADKQNKKMFQLTIALGMVAILQLVIAYWQFRIGEVQIDFAHEQTVIQNAQWEYQKMRDDRIEMRDVDWRREDLEAAGRLPVYK